MAMDVEKETVAQERRKRERSPRYAPQVTLGNILTMIGMAGACLLFFLKYNDRLLMVEAAHISSEARDDQFRREILQRLQDLQTDVREIRSQNGVRWRELPPSLHRRDR